MQLLGTIDWQNEVSGFCRCPGESLHTHQTGRKDCRVNLDGAPTIFCFHSSYLPAVSAANRRFRQLLNSGSWSIQLPGGTVLRSGDLLQSNGMVFPSNSPRTTAPNFGGHEKVFQQTLAVHAERFKPELFEYFRWPFAQIVNDSPLAVRDRDAEDQFRTWLRLWPADSTVWIGDVYSSGKPEHRTHFRPVSEWYQIGPVMGNYTCGSAFKPGSYRRSNENLSGHRFLVVESDVLSKDEVGAVFAYLNLRLRFNLHAVIDTAGKSLHGWFDAPRNREVEARLKAVLKVFGCDPKLFTYSQPVRVPGAYRDGAMQRIVWLRA